MGLSSTDAFINAVESAGPDLQITKDVLAAGAAEIDGAFELNG